MDYDGILIRFGELFLKGKNRNRFIDRTVQTIHNKIKLLDESDFEKLEMKKANDHVLIILNGVDYNVVIKQLDFVFGLSSYGLCNYCETDMDKLKEMCLMVANEIGKDGKSIKVETKRQHKKYPLTSLQISQEIGSYVAENSDVDIKMKKPDVIIKVNFREGRSLIVSKIIPALGGMPIGMGQKSLLMLSGGIDSPVAGYLMMKRGLEVEALHFESPPYTSNKAKQKVFDLAEKLAHYMPNNKMNVHLVPFTNLQKAIFKNVPANYGMTVMRRMMYRVASRLAAKYKIMILSNGESIGQVASQTPESMQAINAVTSMPVMRPVGCMDKTEITEIARKIDTFEISIRPYEDCCTVFVPKNPATAPKRGKCEEYERNFDWEPLVNECVENTAKQVIEAGNPIVLDEETTKEIEDLL